MFDVCLLVMIGHSRKSTAYERRSNVIQPDIQRGCGVRDPAGRDQIYAGCSDRRGASHDDAAGGFGDRLAARHGDGLRKILNSHIVEQHRVNAQRQRILKLRQATSTLTT